MLIAILKGFYRKIKIHGWDWKWSKNNYKNRDTKTKQDLQEYHKIIPTINNK